MSVRPSEKTFLTFGRPSVCLKKIWLSSDVRPSSRNIRTSELRTSVHSKVFEHPKIMWMSEHLYEIWNFNAVHFSQTFCLKRAITRFNMFSYSIVMINMYLCVLLRETNYSSDTETNCSFRTSKDLKQTDVRMEFNFFGHTDGQIFVPCHL